MTTSDNEKRDKDLQQAETYLNAGSEARKDGKLDQAASAFGEAETRFRLAGDLKRAGESCSLLAAAQVQNRMPEQAISSYQRAARLYAALGIAQVFLRQQRWDESLKHCKMTFLCLTQSHDQPAQADALLIQEFAHQG